MYLIDIFYINIKSKFSSYINSHEAPLWTKGLILGSEIYIKFSHPNIILRFSLQFLPVL